MVSKFPTTTRINVSVKALHNAMPSPWVRSYASFVSFRRLTLAEVDEDVLVILRWFWDNNEEARLQQMLCSFLLFTDQLRMQTLHCDTLLMTETADVLFSSFLFKVPKFVALYYCNFSTLLSVTSIKRSCSPFTESLRLVCIIFHLYWMVTESGTVQLKLSEDFSFKQNFIHLFPPKSMLVIFFTWSGQQKNVKIFSWLSLMI